MDQETRDLSPKSEQAIISGKHLPRVKDLGFPIHQMLKDHNGKDVWVFWMDKEVTQDCHSHCGTQPKT